MMYYKAILRKIKYDIDTKDNSYQMKLDANLSVIWKLHAYSDADYAGDNNTQKSVKGCIVIFNGLVIIWSWKIHKLSYY